MVSLGNKKLIPKLEKKYAELPVVDSSNVLLVSERIDNLQIEQIEKRTGNSSKQLGFLQERGVILLQWWVELKKLNMIQEILEYWLEISIVYPVS